MRLFYLFFLLICSLSAYSISNDTIPLSIRQADVANRLSMRYPFMSNNADEVREQPVYLNVTTTAAGQLAEKVGDDINNVDSLIVNGPINDTDFYTLWSGTFYGRLSVINLENAEIINGVIPEWAFCRPKEQVIDGYIYSIGLRRIIFPEGLKFCFRELLVIEDQPSGVSRRLRKVRRAGIYELLRIERQRRVAFHNQRNRGISLLFI